MAKFPLPICLNTLIFLFLHFKTLASAPNSYFSFQGNFKGSNFDSTIALYGDAKVSENGSLVEFTQPAVGSGAGWAIYKKPIKLIEGNSGSMASFSTYFTFSLSHEKEGGLAFFIAPSEFGVNAFGNSAFGVSLESGNGNSRIVAVEFSIRKDGNLDKNNVSIDVGGFVSVKPGNVSVRSVGLSSGKRLHSWIDYEASYKRLEVRLSDSGDRKPVDPLISDSVDLSKIWNDKAVLVGLSSSNANSSQTCFLYSWSFKLRMFPHWMHSQPVDPKEVVKDAKPEVMIRKKGDCFLRVLVAMIFGTTCGAIGASLVFYLWTIFGNRRPVAHVVPEECMDSEYKIVGKAVEEDCKP